VVGVELDGELGASWAPVVVDAPSGDGCSPASTSSDVVIGSGVVALDARDGVVDGVDIVSSTTEGGSAASSRSLVLPAQDASTRTVVTSAPHVARLDLL
jgi:hypothetical protein